MVPKRLGGFTVLEEVSSRAFTVTLRVKHPTLDRTVLVRALKSTVSVTSPFAEELEREAAILSTLDHPSIIRILDFVSTKEAMWIVLEDRRGVSFELLLKNAKPTIVQATAIMLQVARGLGHAHERGVVHKDLRPAHLDLTPSGHVRIIEFASARLPRMPSTPEPLEVGEAFGRPDYMAPEQILGDSAGARSDVFTLGVLYYQLLAGVRPFEADDSKDVAHRIRNVAPDPIADLPGSIDRVLALCLAKDPEDRFEDARAVAAALEEALAAETAFSAEVLVSRALAAAKLGVEIPHSSASPRGVSSEPMRAAPWSGPSVSRALRSLPVVFALILVGGGVIESSRDPETATTPALGEDAPWGGAPEERGFLRVVAAPWADVLIDGERVDTTPIGRPIPVRAGRHWVTFRHPYAPDEQRSVKIVGGQTIFLDVAMRVSRPGGDAGVKRDAGPPEP